MAIFARRHYEAIASVMQKQHPLADGWGEGRRWQFIRDELAEMFARDNPNFKRDRFKGACTPGANVRAHHEKRSTR